MTFRADDAYSRSQTNKFKQIESFLPSIQKKIEEECEKGLFEAPILFEKTVSVDEFYNLCKEYLVDLGYVVGDLVHSDEDVWLFYVMWSHPRKSK